MNQRLDFSHLGGFPLEQDHLDFMQVSYRAAFGALSQLVGDKTILYGVQVQGGQVTDGWISYNGELMPFRGGALSSGVIIQETGDTLTYLDGSVYTAKFTKYATCGSPASFAFADLSRPQSVRDSWQTGDIKMVKCTADYIAANFDSGGTGINERLGWIICQELQGRFPVGYDMRATNPGNTWWDALYHQIGQTGGEKTHQLTTAELPVFRLKVVQADGVTPFVEDTNHGGGLISIKGDSDNSSANGFIQTESLGQNQPHENRPPFYVTLFIEKL